MKSRRVPLKSQRGSSLLEFTLVGIGIMFVLISVFEISRAMWVYNTLAHAAKQAVRFAIVHGSNCDGACTKTVAQIADEIALNGVGLETDQLQVRMATGCGGAPDSSNKGCSETPSYATLDSLRQINTRWPPEGNNAMFSNIEIELRYPFRSALAMFWPGAGPGTVYGTITLGALAREMIQY